MSRSRWTSRRAAPWVARIDKSVRDGLTVPVKDIKRSNLGAQPQRATAVTEEHHQAQAMLDYIGDAILSTDIQGKITYMNRSAETLTGFSRKDATGRPLQDIFHVIDMSTRGTRANLARQAMDTDTAIGLHNGALLINRSGQELAIEDSAVPLHNANNEVIGAMVLFHDARYSSEMTARMTYLAQHDPLTGLLNRHAFAERFHQEAGLARRHQKKMVLLFIDLDNFKEMNDALGHSNGDAILKALGQKLLESVRATDHVGRHGGDEFVVLLSDIEAPEQAFAVVDKVHDAAAQLLELNGETVSLKVSIGVSVYPDNGGTLEALLPHADAAMYRVKAANRRHRKHPPEPTAPNH